MINERSLAKAQALLQANGKCLVFSDCEICPVSPQNGVYITEFGCGVLENYNNCNKRIGIIKHFIKVYKKEHSNES